MTVTTDSLIKYFPPMGVYETLYKFLDHAGVYMGSEGTHPWAQGFPMTTPVPNGPEIPLTIDFSPMDLRYPPATGGPELLQAICDYYIQHYGAQITPENVAVFAGGRPGIYAILAHLQEEVTVLIEETEYTPYYDVLQLLGRQHRLIPSHPGNRFAPDIEDYRQARMDVSGPTLVVKSNPCNPTGITWTGDALRGWVEFCNQTGHGGLIDEAYEFFHTPPVSAMAFIENIDDTNLFVVSAATKGLQVPGARIGWVIAAKRHVEIFRNFSSIAMGGVSRLSQRFVSQLLAPARAAHARRAVSEYFGHQRTRYGQALDTLGFELFTGEGGFYHWGRLPKGLTADEFNLRLFDHRAAILPGTLCDMLRRGAESPLADFMRFSFGPLSPDSFENDILILRAALAS
ncbi:MAG TPA: pyridoxal phosphate-dependent aminotransferase [Pirellulaceae bacterium]|nr:pyridoxal phosphate-dependent aminotransferase [Pirellulaceae bacterium]